MLIWGSVLCTIARLKDTTLAHLICAVVCLRDGGVVAVTLRAKFTSTSFLFLVNNAARSPQSAGLRLFADVALAVNLCAICARFSKRRVEPTMTRR